MKKSKNEVNIDLVFNKIKKGEVCYEPWIINPDKPASEIQQPTLALPDEVL